MGCECSCLRSGQGREQTVECVSTHPPDLQSILETPTSDSSLHAAAKGYLLRKQAFAQRAETVFSQLVRSPQAEEAEEVLGPFPLPEGFPDLEQLPVKRLSNGSLFKGQAGFGVQVFPHGSKYIGHFCNGQVEGYGRLVEPSGTAYEGEFREGKANGHGVYVEPDGVVYEGDFVVGPLPPSPGEFL